MLKALIKIAVVLTTVAIVSESISESIRESENEEKKVISVAKKVPVHIVAKIITPVYDEMAKVVDKTWGLIDAWNGVGVMA